MKTFRRFHQPTCIVFETQTDNARRVNNKHGDGKNCKKDNIEIFTESFGNAQHPALLLLMGAGADHEIHRMDWEYMIGEIIKFIAK